MTDWKPINEAPEFDPSADDLPPQMLVWVNGYGARFGEVWIRKSGERQPRAHGMLGDFKITHFMLIDPPEEER